MTTAARARTARRCAGWRRGAALLLAPLLAAAHATPEEAAQLGQSLTPVGAQQSANADGTIPPWGGGLVEAPACFKGEGARYCNPFADDRPLFTITAENLGKYVDHLSAGQRTLFDKYPDSYRMNVYATRRTFANPAALYQGALANALHAELAGAAPAVSGAVAGVPFPLPKSGAEAIWNHKLRWRGDSVLRWNVQLAASASGDFALARIREEVKFPLAALTGRAPDALLQVRQLFSAPPRIAGSIVLMQEDTGKPADAFRAWQYAPPEKKVHKAPNIGFDNPAPGSDGLRTADQDDVFSGPLERYDFKLIGKKELFVPANAYELHSDAHPYKDIVRKGHINQELARYELRRVWIVEATLRKGQIHLYRRRTFYLDEDGWQIRVADVYDGQGELSRVQEGHTVIAYDKPYEMPVCETVYDLASGRYLAQALNNEEPETAGRQYEDGYFDVSKASRLIAR